MLADVVTVTHSTERRTSLDKRKKEMSMFQVQVDSKECGLNVE